MLCLAPWLSHANPGLAQAGAAPSSSEPVRKVVGNSHFLALMADGSVWAWGRGYDGELGLGPAARSARLPTGDPGITAPQRIAELEDITQISVSGTVGHALRRDGALFAWGPRDAGLVVRGAVATGRFLPPRSVEPEFRLPVALGTATAKLHRGVGPPCPWVLHVSGALRARALHTPA